MVLYGRFYTILICSGLYILIQALITLLIAFIPIYFYIDASIKNQDIKDKLDLQNYSNQIIEKIDNFNNSLSMLWKKHEMDHRVCCI